MIDDNKFSAKIKQLRVEKLMMSQEELANLLGISFQSVNRYENNKSKPTFKIRRKIVELMEKNGIEVGTNE